MLASGSHRDGVALFSGSGFMPTQATQAPDSTSSPAKSRGSQAVIPLTVRQIGDVFNSSDDKSALVVDGLDAANVKLLGLVMNKVERVSDVSFTLDDSTGRIEICRWTNEASDTNEVAAIQNGMYVKVNGQLKGLQGKRHVMAFSVRPVTDFNDVTLHFIECIHINLENTRSKVQRGYGQIQTNTMVGTHFQSGFSVYQAPLSNQYSARLGTDGSENDVHNLVSAIFKEPASLAREHGLHIDEIARRLGLSMNEIIYAINHLVDVGHIYSTIDDNHFKSATNC